MRECNTSDTASEAVLLSAAGWTREEDPGWWTRPRGPLEPPNLKAHLGCATRDRVYATDAATALAYDAAGQSGRYDGLLED